MTASGTLVLSGTISGVPSGQQVVDVPWVLPNAIGQTGSITLAIGDNLINIPAGNPATVLIQPPNANTIPITMKRVPGDTGWDLHPAVPAYPSLNTTMASFYLTVTALLPGPVQITFW